MSTPIHVRTREEEARPGSPSGGDAALLASKTSPSPRLLFRRALVAAAATTAAVTAASWLVPRYAATLVGLVFLGATWLLVLRGDERTIRRHGLSLGGLLEPVAIDPRRLLREASHSLGWVVLLALLLFPPFWLGFRAYWGLEGAFHLRLPPSIGDEVMGQLLVTALPEEAFFRGYLQTSLDAVWPPRWRLAGATLGPAWIVSAAVFAIGHLLTVPNPARLAVFFPALAFGWLRARTGGVGAPILFHASCNVLSATIARGYGLAA